MLFYALDFNLSESFNSGIMKIVLSYQEFFILLSVVLVLLILVVLFFLWILHRTHKPDLLLYSREQLQQRWKEVESLLENKSDMHYRLAVIEADKLLDHSLKALGFPGEDMGQRLKAACYRHEPLRSVWYAHKMRNQLVHESNFHPTYWQAKDAIREFHKALSLLRIL